MQASPTKLPMDLLRVLGRMQASYNYMHTVLDSKCLAQDNKIGESYYHPTNTIA